MDIGNQNQWILESGSSQHVKNNLHLIYNRVKINETMEMENDSTERCEIKGKVKLRLGNKIIVLTEFYYLKMSKNIIRITKFMYKIFKVIGKGDQFQIIKNNQSIISTSKIKTKHVFVVILEENNAMNNITYDLMHQCLGNPGKETIFKLSEIIGEKISTIPSSILPCEDFSLEKIRRQDLLKSTSSRESKTGQIIYIDTSWDN